MAKKQATTSGKTATKAVVAPRSPGKAPRTKTMAAAKKNTNGAKSASARPRKKAAAKSQPASAAPEAPERVASVVPTKEQQQFINGRLLAAQFGDMVTVLMQTKFYENLRLKDLRDYVVPPLMNKQYRIAEARKKGTGNSVPAALILWARVSDEVQDKLTGALDAPFLLSADEWTSGDNYWIIDAIGHERYLAPLLTDLRKTDFDGRNVKYRVRTPDGPAVRSLEEQPE